ncbi:cytochrome c [Fimbriiglobus ruber]|uniref:Cytochrome C n=1 Tax=Fimbriiglobus ruber TaxID=1908690 RepID=A0A225DJP7_9BACT|nr:cytochrome c [Fimbriiglobus ruber]OWK36615.1 hypothetical protein FRUB_09178 [Fimbriiglobus ruber]
MQRKLFALVVGVACLSLTAFAADDKKVPSIKEIMKKGHQGTKSLLSGIKAEVKGEKWDEASTNAKLLKDFGEALGQNKPAKGDEDSWKKLSEKYKTNTAAVADAVEKKDAKATADALGVIGKSCGECHMAHKGK